MNDILENIKQLWFTKDDKKLGVKDQDLLNRFTKSYPNFIGDSDFKNKLQVCIYQ